MPATALPENYCVCVGEDGSPREIGRSGAAVTYKAMGYQSGQAAALQLIPLATVSETGRAQFEWKVRAVRNLKHPNIARALDVRVEDDHIVFATEYLQGETAEAWVVAHGPMPTDAVLRIGLQVVSALAEAAFHSLSHRAIQPSNVMIVTGAAPDGEWPFVKLLNFGLAGLKLYSEGKDELVPSIATPFASPEQLENGKVDFRSEIFSLGATMCFLLIGAVPLAGRSRRSGDGERVLPSGVAIPRSVRKLLRRMLRINPDERPRDPLLFTEELQRCLRKAERRPSFSRHLDVPLEAEPRPERTARRGLLIPILTGATLLLMFAALGAVLLPGQLRWWTNRNQPLESIGVPIGVPETPASWTTAADETIASESPAALAQNSSSPSPAQQKESDRRGTEQPSLAQASPPASPPAARSDSSAQPSAPVVAQQSATSNPEQPEPTGSATPRSPEHSSVQDPPLVAQQSETPPPANTPAEIAANNRMAEPPPPAEAPPAATAAPPPDNVEEAPAVAEQQPQPAEPNVRDGDRSEIAPTPASPPAAKVNSPRQKIADAAGKSARANSVVSRSSNTHSARRRSLPPMRVGATRAQFVGTTDDGKWILKLPSGNTVVTPPLPDTSDAPVISHRRVRRVQIPPRAIPADQLPPVVVLPPQD